MKRFFVIVAVSLAALALYSTPSFATSRTTIGWQEHGSENLPCSGSEHWVLSPAQGITSATLYIDGVPYAMSQNGNGSYSADTNVGFDGSQAVSVTYFGDNDSATAALYDDFEAVQPADVAAVIEAAIDLPPHVDLTAIEILPTQQVFGGSRIARDSTG